MGLIVLVLFVPHQIAGMLLMSLRDGSRVAADQELTLRTSFLVLSGTVLGIGLPVVTLTFFFGLLFAIALFVVLLPITLPATLLLRALPSSQKKSEPSDSAEV